MKDEPTIGVVGGMGPYAGIDLVRKIFDETRAASDQEHLPVAMLSYAHKIQDRSAYILGRSQTNPAPSIAAAVADLSRLGSVVVGMPCNSAHAPVIFNAIAKALPSRVRLLHLIKEAVAFARHSVPGIQRVGPLSTLALHRIGLYRDQITAAGLTAVMPADNVADGLVNRAIFDPDYGIKAHSNPVTDEARQWVLGAIRHLGQRGAEAVILGCTELPLAVGEPRAEGVRLVDATRALARALIRETYPDQLRPLDSALRAFIPIPGT